MIRVECFELFDDKVPVWSDGWESSVSQFFVPIGSCAALMGAAVLLPVVLDTVERGGPTELGIGVASAGGVFVVCGLAVLVAGFDKRLKVKPLGNG